ncbi:anaphase-promoting complex subunit 1-like [Gigantopelta aegis]|uniref:anaphase-promoting complex subunit 1-like n=1 Tax=Gigantopelta aegis TaxID=1735272 RepID=UPI001B88822C|nr:anaphase-promoting complex subunit 1-like [Gigantopelta aegis]
MIAACETQDFIPFGREYMRYHPGQFQLRLQGINTFHADHGLPLLKSFRDISLHDTGKKEQWIFHDASDNEGKRFDEELYVSGKTVVWSRGGQDGAKVVVTTYTVDTPVLQALWGSFILPSKDLQNNVPISLEPPGVMQHGICVVEATNLSFFLDNGGEYSTSLPFQVSHVWVMKNGLLFERTVSHAELTAPKKNAPNQTVVFSLLHPLDEVAPVIIKTSGVGDCPKVNYMTDNTQNIVFTSEQPSLAFTYDTVMGVHSAWQVRRSRVDEQSMLSAMFENTSFMSMTTPNLNYSSSNHSRIFNNISSHSPGMSPFCSLSGRLTSPASFSRSQSPGFSHIAGVSRSQSPAMTSGLAHKFQSPSQNWSPAAYLRTPSAANNFSIIGSESFTDRVKPIQPEVCLEHIWTEPAPPIRDGPLGKSSKAFLSKDVCDQQYLCYMVPYRHQLRCVKFEESNDLSRIIFGSVTNLSAKDAAPIESLDMLVVLEPTGFLVIYSGITKISHVYIPLLPLGSGSLSMMRATTPVESPSRGGIFTSSRPPSALDARFDEEVNQISPVPTEMDDSSNLEGSISDMPPLGNSFIQILRDNVDNRFTLELLNGQMCRTAMPPIASSPGIVLCLNALKHMLPRNTALQFVGRWYTARNSPGGLAVMSEWNLFYRTLLSLMGYDTSRLSLTSKHDLDSSMSPMMSSKRPRHSDQGSEDDWDFLVNSSHHAFVVENRDHVYGLSPCTVIPDRTAYSKPCCINSSAPLFPHCPAIMLALHLVYEEMKLNITLLNELKELAPLLFQISCDLKCISYMDYYTRDFPRLFDQKDDMSQINTDHLTKMQYPQYFPSQVPSVYFFIYNSLNGQDQQAMLYIPMVCSNINNIISLYAMLLHRDLPTEVAIDRCLKKIAPAGHRAPTADASMSLSFLQTAPVMNTPERLVLSMTQLGITDTDLDCMPVGIALPFREAILHCRCNPPSDWPEEAYILIGRQDLSQLIATETQKPKIPSMSSSTHQEKQPKEEEDGMEHMDEELLKLRFNDDLRVQEVRRLLQSSKPAKIALVQRPEVSDHDFIEEQERHLYSICIRTMALPTGRGMFSLCTFHPVPTEPLPTPKLCLTGKAPPRNTAVDLSHIDVPANMASWPHFHNGVAAGLRIANSSQFDSTWIMYNKPKLNEAAAVNEYSGFLMALGLNGHLTKLTIFNVHDYLSKGHEMTTIGILLGLSAAKRGTMDMALTRVLSIHVLALLPPTSTELNIHHNVQAAAILGVGLVYYGTGHLHMAETLLAEIGRLPGPEMENCTDRESYALAAGLALGLIMFGKGKQVIGLSDHSMADTLCHFMVGGHRRPLPNLFKERCKAPSYLNKEGNCVNVDVTAPGATLALGMMFFSTGNGAVAEWLKAPDTQFMLEHVRPDFLMLRTLSRGLVLWESVMPSLPWVDSNIPDIVKKYAFKKGVLEEDDDTVIDYETMSQAYSNIVAGACMTMGLKFAGSANEAAFNTLMDCLKRLFLILSTSSFSEQTGKSTIENCVNVILTSVAMVMAGSGNLEVLRMCRMLRKRIGPQYSYMVYGSHMAIAMATGLLFLGGGRYTLSTKPEAIAALICAFFPKYPTHSNDNRYHLQAFRHLYVLAAEPRVVLPRDVDSGKPCYVPLEIRFKNSNIYSNVTCNYKTIAPCILPELDLIEEIKVLGPRYWPIVFHAEKNWNILQSLLNQNGELSVKQRAGHLSFVEDPQGYRSMLAKSLIADHISHCSHKPEVVKAFASDPRIITLAECFLKSGDKLDCPTLRELATVVYQCITQDKPGAIGSHFVLQQLMMQCECGIQTAGVWQLKFVLAYYRSRHRICSLGDEQPKQLLDLEFLLYLKHHVENLLDKWEAENTDIILKYLRNESLKGQELGCLSAFLSWFDIPNSTFLDPVHVEGPMTLPALCKQLTGLKVTTLMKILSAWKVGS